MLTFKFFYDYHNESFRCTLIDNHVFRGLKLDSAKEAVRKFHFNEATIMHNTIQLSNDSVQLIIDDFDKIKLIRDVLANHYRLIEEALYGVSQSKNKSQLMLNIKGSKKLITGCALTSAVMLIGIGKIFSMPTSEAVSTPAIIGSDIVEDINNEIIPELHTLNVDQVVEPQVFIEKEVAKEIIVIDHGTDLDTITYQGAFDEYYDMVYTSATKWGLDPDLIMAMLTQESAGKVTNLMQFNYESFRGGTLTAYNFDKNKYETFFFTDSPEYVSNEKYTVVRKKDLADPQTNIDMGALFVRTNIDLYDHMMAGILCYNQGFGNMDKIFAETKIKTGKSKDDILSDQEDLSFYAYAYASHQGDKNYLKNVFKYFPNDEITYKVLEDGEVKEKVLILQNEEMKKETQKVLINN